MSDKVKYVIKRDGTKSSFDPVKIEAAINKAVVAVNDVDSVEVDKVRDAAVLKIEERSEAMSQTSVEDIQDIIEKSLIEFGYANTAKAFILYRQKRREMRKIKEDILGTMDDSKLSPNGLIIAKSRYLLKDKEGKVMETPKEMFRRVASEIAKEEKKYGSDPKEIEERFYEILYSLEFVPGGRILAGAGTKHSQLYSCFVLPVEDSIKGIFQALYEKAMLQRVGGGTGFSFSRLRPKGTRVVQSDGYASGPVSFMYMFDHASDLTVQSGNRKGANMGSISVHHPDIIEFITSKEKKEMHNFNISVEMTDVFMEAVRKNLTYELINPQTGKPIDRIPARNIFDLIVTMAWKNGDPGVLFIDRINRDNPTPELGRIETTDPCGDQPLLPYDACALGAINLSLFVKKKEIDWKRLKTVVKLAVRFLDDVVDATNIPVKKIKDTVLENRRIGIGVMGFADMLYALEVPYNTNAAVQVADQVSRFIYETALEESKSLAKERGPFPNWEKSIFKDKYKVRNAGLVNISPTGSRSILADTSSGIEPNFALGYVRKISAGFELVQVNKIFEAKLKELGIYDEDLIRQIAKSGDIDSIDSIPENVKRVFMTAYDVSPLWHIKIQAAFQKNIDNAISKTVNFPKNATISHIKKVFLKAYKMGCKGITVYRDGSLSEQVISLGR